MKFRFCGEADCPDWVLAEIITLSRLSSIKLRSLTQVVIQGIITPPIDLHKSKKLFSDSKLDLEMDLKSSIACLEFIVSSAVRYNCNSSALHTELQQLGLPREHSTSIKRVIDEKSDELVMKFKSQSLKVNPLETVLTEIDTTTNCLTLDLAINEEIEKVTIMPHTLGVLLENLKEAKQKMVQMKDNPLMFS